MREARFIDLRFIQQIGEGGFGKVRGERSQLPQVLKGDSRPSTVSDTQTSMDWQVYYGHWCGNPVAIKVATMKAAESSDHQARLQEFQREVARSFALLQG